MSRDKASLAEQWFIQDQIELIDKMETGEKEFTEMVLKSFDENREKALSQVYKLSRAVRVKRLMSGDFDAARNTPDDCILNLMQFIGYGCFISFDQHTKRRKGRIEE